MNEGVKKEEETINDKQIFLEIKKRKLYSFLWDGNFEHN